MKRLNHFLNFTGGENEIEDYTSGEKRRGEKRDRIYSISINRYTDEQLTMAVVVFKISGIESPARPHWWEVLCVNKSWDNHANWRIIIIMILLHTHVSIRRDPHPLKPIALAIHYKSGMVLCAGILTIIHENAFWKIENFNIALYVSYAELRSRAFITLKLNWKSP